MDIEAARSDESKKIPARFLRIRKALMAEPLRLCAERALLVTGHFRQEERASEPMVVRRARAFKFLLKEKSARIFDDELIAGNPGRHRKSVIIQPELTGMSLYGELLRAGAARTAPFVVSWQERLKVLFTVAPFWLFRNSVFGAFRGQRRKMVRFMAGQLGGSAYLINESMGIGHFIPDYEKMLVLGVKGFLKAMEGGEGSLAKAARIACEGLAAYASQLSREAKRLAYLEKNPERSAELREISRICAKVPMGPAETFYEALQSLWLTHMAVCLEGMDSAVSFGRIDQYLLPYYRNDLEEGRITRQDALELVLCFLAKTAEHAYLLGTRMSGHHGGFPAAQDMTLGGTDAAGRDAVNELTWLFLDAIELSGQRGMNLAARVHTRSDPAYVHRAVEAACRGSGGPALLNDKAAFAALAGQGIERADAVDYAIVGGASPGIPGKSCCPAQAAFLNLPLCLLLALNQGRRPGSKVRIGAETPGPAMFVSMDDVIEAFKTQLELMVDRMTAELRTIEKGHADLCPVPFSSMLIAGCIEKDQDITAGGALYNWSGIQGVGLADTADSLAALHEIVFTRKANTLVEVVEALRTNFADATRLWARFIAAPKFGNGHERPDAYAALIAGIFRDALARHTSTRGGPYLPGFCSSSCHVGFGARTGALPSGRMRGEPFAAGLGCVNGMDRQGPAALLSSVSGIGPGFSPCGCVLNLSFDAACFRGERTSDALAGLALGFFSQDGMEVEFNVFDKDILSDARNHPGKYPGIMVRAGGRSARFDDLPKPVQDELITRTLISLKPS